MICLVVALQHGSTHKAQCSTMLFASEHPIDWAHVLHLFYKNAPFPHTRHSNSVADGVNTAVVNATALGLGDSAGNRKYSNSAWPTDNPEKARTPQSSNPTSAIAISQVVKAMSSCLLRLIPQQTAVVRLPACLSCFKSNIWAQSCVRSMIIMWYPQVENLQTELWDVLALPMRTSQIAYRTGAVPFTAGANHSTHK